MWLGGSSMVSGGSVVRRKWCGKCESGGCGEVVM